MWDVTRAFGYVRLSKYDEGTTSPQRQREAIKALCLARGWELAAGPFEDIDVSGYNGQHRPALESMLARLGEVDAVVVYRIDRLARSSVDFRRLLDRFEQAGVEFVATDLQVDSSASGRLIRDIIARMAEFESDQLSERSKRAVAYNKSQGVWVGQVPFGWRREGKTLVQVPEEQAVLEQAARRYVAGESLRSIAPTIGHTHANLARILRSERVLEALPVDLAGRLATEMAERGRTGTSATPSLLGGVARCGACGGGMTIVAQTTRRGRNPRGAYGCRERGHCYISRAWLDDHVSVEVLAAIDVDRLTKRMARRRRLQPKVMKVPELEARFELLEVDHYERGLIGRESFLRRREGLLKGLATAREAAEADRGPALPLELARRLPDLWPEMTVTGRRQIVKALVKEIRVAKANGHGPVDPSRVAIAWR